MTLLLRKTPIILVESLDDISNRNEFVLENVSGTYQSGKKLNSSSNIISLILTDNGTFSAEATLLLTDGDDDIIARGRILESVCKSELS